MTKSKKSSAKQPRSSTVSLKLEWIKPGDSESEPNPRAAVYVEYPDCRGKRSKVLLGAIEQEGPFRWKADLPEMYHHCASPQEAATELLRHKGNVVAAALVGAMGRIGFEVLP
jgi:hypothetical protein